MCGRLNFHLAFQTEFWQVSRVTKNPVTNTTVHQSIKDWYTYCYSTQTTAGTPDFSLYPILAHYVWIRIRHQRILVCGMWYWGCWKGENPSRFSSLSCYAECACAPQPQTHQSRATDLLYFYFLLDISISSNSYDFTLVEVPHEVLPTFL